MTKGLLINDIELGYAPMTAYHFNKLIKDKEFQDIFFDSHIYIIAQRKELTFNNFNFSKEFVLNFEIRQKENDKFIKCELPFIQKNITTDLTKIIELRLHDRKNTPENKNGYPFNGTQAFSIKSKESHVAKSILLAQYTPDKLFQNYWKGHINVEFSKDFSSFCEYKVQYVGKSTEQNICKRLSSHSTFQEILTNEDSLSYGNIPSNEIMILLFRIKDSNTIVKWGEESTAKEMSDYMTDYLLPSEKAISLDAEKALIKHLLPKYNKILYKSFPNKSDLVNSDFHDTIFYAFCDPIKLIYENGEIKGGELYGERDYITVENEK
jgi:hypothetical protein